MITVEEQIKQLADQHAQKLSAEIDQRIKVMSTDNIDHYLIYRVLGVSASEGELIDVYQNKG
jgi:hypothetical protein